MTVTLASLTRMFLRQISPWSMPAQCMDSNVNTADILFKKKHSTYRVNKLWSQNSLIGDWQNMLQLCSKWNTCWKHCKGAKTSLTVIEETQHHCDTPENPFQPQMAMNIVFVSEGMLLFIGKCKLDNDVQQCICLQLEHATVDYACCTVSYFWRQDNRQTLIESISADVSWQKWRSQELCTCHNWRSRTREHDWDQEVIYNISKEE